MHKFNSTDKSSAPMPRIVSLLLSFFANPAYRDELIGDLEEEYKQRRQNNADTTKWMLRQTALAILDGQKAMVKTTDFVKVLSVLFCVVTLPTIALFVGWLSNMQQPSEQLWQQLLSGEIHSILVTSAYWEAVWKESGLSHLTLGMFINIPSILWAGTFAISGYRLIKTLNVSVWVFSVFSILWMVAPYAFGFVTISTLEPIANKVGPILAFMMLAPFFTLPLYSYFLFTSFKQTKYMV